MVRNATRLARNIPPRAAHLPTCLPAYLPLPALTCLPAHLPTCLCCQTYAGLTKPYFSMR
jgi:hypothetical protein